MSITALPIDKELPVILRVLGERRALVLVAEPGAGKTTRVPPALISDQGAVLVLEPRRVAARMAATRVASELSEAVGKRVGYQVRFERCGDRDTKLWYITEGILARRFTSDAGLDGVAAIVLDEVHERSLEGDVILALLARMRRRDPARAPLLIAMSATMDPAPLARLLDAPVVQVAGRLFPVAIEHIESRARQEPPLDRVVAAAVAREITDSASGDILVFLPGRAEIRRAAAALADLERSASAIVAPLHGSLTLAEQTQALAPATARKIILATNIAESSLTVEGVTVVIDSGLERATQTIHSSGIATLATTRISRASAEQRAGRAGRVRPGRCVRLYSLAEFAAMAPAATPEILRADLSGSLLDLACAGVADFEALDWLDAPPAAALAAARRLLLRLGALDARGCISAIGRKMAALPLDPRMARALIAAHDFEVTAQVAAVAARLEAPDESGRDTEIEDPVDAPRGGERDAARRRAQIERDLLSRLNAPSRSGGADAAATVASATTRASATSASDSNAPATRARRALLIGHPDRVALRRKSGELALASGGSLPMARGGHAMHSDACIILGVRPQASAAGASAVVTQATPIELDWLIDLHSEWIEERNELAFNPSAERVEARAIMSYGAIILEERLVIRPSGQEVEALLARKLIEIGWRAVANEDEIKKLLDRAGFTLGLLGHPPFDREAVLVAAASAAAHGVSSFREIRERGFAAAIIAELGRTHEGLGGAIARLAPEQVSLAGGKRVRVDYHADRPPSIAVYLQDLFGSQAGPSVGAGRVQLVLHLLAPNRRPLQITTDLAGFWQRHYPAIRRELRMRYTRHEWPEDPATAPPAKPKRRPKRPPS